MTETAAMALTATIVPSVDDKAEANKYALLMMEAMDGFMDHAGVPKEFERCGCGLLKGTPERVRQLILDWKNLKAENENLKREIRTAHNG
jgi:hypothetical protein